MPVNFENSENVSKVWIWIEYRRIALNQLRKELICKYNKTPHLIKCPGNIVTFPNINITLLPVMSK